MPGQMRPEWLTKLRIGGEFAGHANAPLSEMTPLPGSHGPPFTTLTGIYAAAAKVRIMANSAAQATAAYGLRVEFPAPSRFVGVILTSTYWTDYGIYCG